MVLRKARPIIMGPSGMLPWRYSYGPIQHLQPQTIHGHWNNRIHAWTCRLIELHVPHLNWNQCTSLHRTNHTMPDSYRYAEVVSSPYGQPIRAMHNLLLLRIYNDLKSRRMRSQRHPNFRNRRRPISPQRFYNPIFVFLPLQKPHKQTPGPLHKPCHLLHRRTPLHIQSVTKATTPCHVALLLPGARYSFVDTITDFRLAKCDILHIY